MSMNLGYAVGTAIFMTPFVVAVGVQIRARRDQPFLFWTVIVATTTAGTTLADLLDRSLGIGCLGGSSILLTAPARNDLSMAPVAWFRPRLRHRLAKGRDVLLGDGHVLPDVRHGTR
jgi:uncharacterized membrane-anchored protein